MRKTIGIFLVSWTLAGAAQAADITEVMESAPNWTALYAGVVGGYGWGDGDSDWIGTGPNNDLLNGNSFTVDVDGALVGGVIGYDYDMGNGLVVGAAADISWSDIDGRDCAEITGCAPGGPFPLARATLDVDWFATVRARLGFGMDNMLFYATGGLAVADTDLKVTNIVGSTPGKDSKTRTGFAVGGGMEFKVSESISLGAEYIYADFGKSHYDLMDDGTNTAKADTDLQLNIVRGSLTYRFQ